MVIRNFEIINIITSIKKEDDLAFLSPLSTQNPCFREDSFDSSSSYDSSNSSSSSASCWESKEKKLRILKKVEDAVSDFINKDDYASFCWEDIVF
ncbi:uncharacterized protein BX663DRAFT_444261 [Cokeromyces recurvatus]|uniref:uncharacterized protein n=1 Tax=Cokeromyces recurvatus TaxID=90255 RepID=UPI00222094A4|nr:uncharacterized protein BX663DRAFT_276637 [Cokeromyces recurvatus]XP_051377850.1 uncharacterized protein BX663DRAFT_444261 [Cokeromyces recurvatus]KAI7897862.1 hypothetical protein BX663DRAFT_276637 [Cokeromyces recurvatus]KAI7897865.1 hypothetical protein BX663DRAFT_444261 [Cokeromyces recurvatus]